MTPTNDGRYDFNKHVKELPAVAAEHVLGEIDMLRDELTKENIGVETTARSLDDDITASRGATSASEHLDSAGVYNSDDIAERLGVIGGVCVVDAIALNIADQYTDEAAADFLRNADFQDYKSNTDEVQRGLVNRVLVRKLLAHRADNPEPVVDIVLCLVPDGDVESWMTVFKIAVLPYLKANNVRL